MSRKDRKPVSCSPPVAPQSAKGAPAKVLNYALAFALGAALAGGAVLILRPPITSTASPQQSYAGQTHGSRSLEELLGSAPEQLAKVDIAEMNLLCATGLPGAEELDIDKCLATLDRWAAKVKDETERHLYRLTDPRYQEHAEHYRNSEARFRAEWLVSVLRQDIGLHYHAGFVAQDEAVKPLKTSKETFIHGLMDNEDARKSFGGNCVSLPVAYAAVGRRLGYPVKLVCAKEHTFCRWEGTDNANTVWRDRFNFDGAGEGFSIDPDEFYLTWPRKSTREQVELSDWMKSLTPQQELALFMAARGHVFSLVVKDNAAALVAFSQATRLWPTSRGALQEVNEVVDRLWAVEVAAHAQIYRRVYGVEVAGGRVVPVARTAGARPSRDFIEEVEIISEINRRNMDRLMQPPPMRGGIQPPSPYGPSPGAPHPYRPVLPGQPPL